MSSLTDIDKRYIETLLGMQSGYVLDFTDATFAEFFHRHKIDIHSEQYQTYGTSKAKKLRAFWGQEADELVGRTLDEMLDSYEAQCLLSGTNVDSKLLNKAREITARLQDGTASPPAATVDEFLSREFPSPNFQKLPIDSAVAAVIKARLDEARKVHQAGAYLSTIFLCGSILEAILLGAASNAPAAFNQSKACPKDKNGKPKNFNEWPLAQLIDAACEIGLFKVDIQKFGHGLRDFRNYIHPYEQLISGFTPDEHTAKVCIQVLNAALASVAGER